MFGGKIDPTDFANFDLENGVITSEVGDVSPKNRILRKWLV
jgi:hypothetical protein